ncbi:TPA: tape measure protein [Serratia marcescens]
MANSKDVELRIRARDYSQKPLKAVANAIDQMARAQEEQRKAAERGEISTRELEAAYKKLESAGTQLLKLNSLIEVFKRQNVAMTEAAAKTEALRAKQADLQKQYDSSTKVTQKQETALARINRQVEAATKAEAAQADRVAKTTRELERYGIETSKIGQAQTGIVNSVAQVNKVLERQDEIISTSAAAAAQAKVIRGLQQQADQAIAASRGYQTLGRVVQQATGQLGPLGTQIQAIVSPAEAARSTLAGMQQQVAQVSTELARNGKQVDNAAQKIRMLNEANKAISGLAQQIDLYRQQVATLRSARTEYQAARQDVMNLAQQMRSATTDTGALGIQMQAAQQRMSAAAQALRNTGNAARSTQAALRSAGVDTRNLSDAENRLVATSKQSTSAVNTLTEALRRNGGAARDSGKAFSFFADNGRTTLSAVQRLKGEVLALTTAYVGFQGAINLAGGSVEAYKMRQQAMIKISNVVGDSQQAINKEWEYMIGLSNKLGIDLTTLSQSYTKFAVSAKAVGLSLNDSKFIFESVAKAGRVFHLSQDDMEGVFRALEQMLSKGQVYAEELRGQLGERLPAAFALFAKGMDMTTAQLSKAMDNGEISGEAVINFAREQAKAVDAQLATAEKGVDAMEARARNAMTMFKLALADSGFIEAYVQMLNKITDFLNSEDGKQAAQNLGTAFSKAADAVVFLTENIDGLITVLGVLAGLKAVGFLVGLYENAKKLIPVINTLSKVGQGIITFLEGMAAKMIAAGGAAGVLGTALKGLTRAIPFVGWALLAYDIGAIFYEQSQTFREVVNAVVRDFKNLGNQILAIGKSFPAILYDLAVGIARPITTMFASTIKTIAKWIADVVKMIPGVGQGLADWTMSVADDLTKEQRNLFESTGAVWDDVNKKWVQLNDEMVAKNTDATAIIKKKVADMVSDIKAATTGSFEFTSDPNTGVTKRSREIAGLTKELDKMETAAKKADVAARKAEERKNLPGRLKLIDEEFAPQYARAKSIGGTEGADLTKRLDAVVAARKKAETTMFNAQQRTTKGTKAQENALQALINKYNELNATVGVKQAKQDPNATFDDRLTAKLAAVNAQYDALIQKANKIGGKGGQQVASDLEALRQRNLEYATTQAKLEELKRIEDQLNAQQETKKNLLDEINAKRQAGIISEDEAVAQTVALYQNMNAGIASSADQLDQFAIKIKETMSEEEFSRIMAQIASVKAGLVDLTGTFTTMDTTVVQGVLDGMSTALSSVVNEMAQVVAGNQSIGQSFANLGVAMAKFFADFLQKIAMAILQQMALNALAGMGGGIGGAASALGGVAAKHNGGIIGSKTTSGQQSKGSVSPALFAGAPRFHDGGLPGLKSDEVPTILQKGEQVLSKNDPNNILNRVGSGGQQTQSQPGLRFVLVDDRAKIPEAMNTPEGETAIMQILRRNVPTLKNLVS